MSLIFKGQNPKRSGLTSHVRTGEATFKDNTYDPFGYSSDEL